jgi:hypothetical protein
MSWFKKCDLVQIDGKPAIVDSDVYTKFVSEDYSHNLGHGDGEGGSTITCVNVIFPNTGIKWTVETNNVTCIGREMP